MSTITSLADSLH